MLSSPCRNCDERELGCHSHCIAYKRWKAKHGEIVIRIHEDETASRNMENQIRRKLWS